MALQPMYPETDSVVVECKTKWPITPRSFVPSHPALLYAKDIMGSPSSLHPIEPLSRLYVSIPWSPCEDRYGLSCVDRKPTSVVGAA